MLPIYLHVTPNDDSAMVYVWFSSSANETLNNGDSFDALGSGMVHTHTQPSVVSLKTYMQRIQAQNRKKIQIGPILIKLEPFEKFSPN